MPTIYNYIYRMEILENEFMSAHTSFKVGGPAKFFAKVESESELVEIHQKAQRTGLPCFLLGKGTNLLVSDKGFDGFIIQLGKSFSEIKDLGNGKFRVGAATPLARFARFCINQGYADIHKLAGIPGSLGGAIYMNAGAYGQEICNGCVEVVSMDAVGNLHTRAAGECKFGYRHSLFQELAANRAEVILSATFQLTPAASLGKTSADLESEMQECMEKRRKSQPLNMPNAGSTFKRLAAGAAETPAQIAPGYYIEQAGLKGYRIGGAEVSQVHANFIVNTGGATASDIKALSEFVQKKVADKFNIHLQREIILLGEF
ncbi:MAG: UDP-N-acetylmuramate dehydrogenase [Fibrobacter sp.]|nr:UDP-N-acetylmuramate dehydrogenase [Fibrobacter sp.]